MDTKTTMADENEDVSNYERERIKNVQKNQELLLSLGLLRELKNTRPPGHKRKRISKSKVQSVSSYPIRRSSRLKNSYTTSPNKSLAHSAAKPLREADTSSRFYDSSSVLHYAAEVATITTSSKAPTEGKVFKLNFFEDEFGDPKLKKIYSMDWQNDILLAGGHNGQIALFGASNQKLLMSFRASKGWISSVQFHSKSNMRFLSSSNDGSVILWDSSLEASGVPKIRATNNSLHSNGIFALHELDSRIVTGSKDRSVCLSHITLDGDIAKLRKIEDVHDGVVKSVRLNVNQPSLSASSGNDSTICLHDSRISDEKFVVSRAMEAHENTCVNSLRWHPSNPHIIMTAAFNTKIELRDTRSFSQPFRILDSHMPAGISRSRNIYHPVFFNSGSQILTSGDRSDQLTIYDFEDGTVLSRGTVNFCASSLAVENVMSRDSRIAAAHGQYISVIRAEN